MRTTLSVMLFFCLLACYPSCKSDDSLYKANRLNEEALRLSDMGRNDEALLLLHQALSYNAVPDSNRRVFFSNLALTHDALDNTDSAKYFLKQAIELSPKRSFVYYTGYAQLYLIDTLVGKAIDFLEKSYQLNSDYGPTNNLLGLIYLGTYDPGFYNPQKALPYNLKAYESFRDVNGRNVLAQNYYYLEMVEKSVSLFKELHRDYPDNVDYLTTIIMMEQELGNDCSMFLDKMKPLDPEAYRDLTDNPLKAGTHTIEW